MICSLPSRLPLLLWPSPSSIPSPKPLASSLHFTVPLCLCFREGKAAHRLLAGISGLSPQQPGGLLETVNLSKQVTTPSDCSLSTVLSPSRTHAWPPPPLPSLGLPHAEAACLPRRPVNGPSSPPTGAPLTQKDPSSPVAASSRPSQPPRKPSPCAVLSPH